MSDVQAIDVTDAKLARQAEAAEVKRAEKRIADLRERIATFASGLESEFDPDVIARALLVEAGASLLRLAGPFGARWSISRTLDMMVGHWVEENLNSFVASYQK